MAKKTKTYKNLKDIRKPLRNFQETSYYPERSLNTTGLSPNQAAQDIFF